MTDKQQGKPQEQGSVEEMAKEEVDKLYPANEYYQTNLGRALVETTRVKFMEGFKAGFLAASPKGKEEDRACPCQYLDEPCQPHCTCKNGLWSHGCLYCCTYGSLEQRKEKAKWLASKISAPQPKDTSGMQVKALPEVLELDGTINSMIHGNLYVDIKIIQVLFWKAIDAIQSAPLLSTQQGERMFTLEEILLYGARCAVQGRDMIPVKYFKENFNVDITKGD